MNLSHKAKQDFLYIVLALVIIGGLYFGYKAFDSYNKHIEYALAQNGRITKFEQDFAYVIREENVIDTGRHSGERQIIVADNNRAATGTVIASFSTGDNQETKEKISEIDAQIQEIMGETQYEPSQDIKAIESSLESNLYSIVQNRSDLYSLKNRKHSLDELLERKIKQIADENKGSDLRTLVNERISLEKEMAKNKVDIKTDKAGLVSYRVDGYEALLTPHSFSDISVEQLKKIKFQTDQIVPISTDKIKITNNFYAYLIVVSNSDEVKNLHLNDSIKYTINNDFNNLSKGTVDYIINDDDYRYVFIKTNDNVEKLSLYRKLNVKLVWWNYQGIRVPDDSILEEAYINNSGDVEHINYVNIKSGTGYNKKVWIKVEKSAEGFSIIDNYKDGELEEMGFDSEKIRSRNNLNLYDEVVRMGD